MLAENIFQPFALRDCSEDPPFITSKESGQQAKVESAVPDPDRQSHEAD